MKKLFTLAAAVMASFSLTWATDKTPSSTLDISSVTTENWGTWLSGTTPKLDANGFHITGYMARQSSAQTWVGFMGGNTGGQQGDTYEAPEGAEYSLGSAAYGNDGRFMTMRTNRTMYFRVTGCSEAHALVQSQSNGTRKVAITAYEYSTARAPEAFVTDTTENNANAMEEIGVSGLNPALTYEILVSGSASDNSNFYEICFVASSAPTYTVTYKANNGINQADVIDNEAKKVAENKFEAEEGFKFAGWNTESDGSGDEYEVNAALEGDVTLYAQWVVVCYEVLYDFAGGVGSAEVTANDAYIVEDSLAMTNSAGRITITPKEGETFKAGDIIEFSGTVGNAGKPFGIKIGGDTYEAASVTANDPDEPKAGGTASYSGVLKADAATLAIGRDGGTTTKLVTLVIKREVECSDDDVPSALGNTEAEVKAVKRIVNGQLLIEKNGVLYNAQGAIVK